MQFLRRISPARWGFPVWAAVVMIGIILSSYAWIVSSPSGSSPDEDFHMVSIWCPDPVEKYCPVITNAQGNIEVLVPQKVAWSSCYAFYWDVSARCVYDLSNTELTSSGRYNNGLYPGVYYHVMHLFVTSDVDRTVLTIRWVNAGLASLLFGAVFFLAPLGRRLVVYTMLGTSVPLVTYFINSINPSAWGIMGVVGAWLAIHLALSSSPGWRRVSLLGVGLFSALIASAARSDAGLYLGVMAAAIVLWHWPEIRRRLRILVPLVVVGVIGATGFLSGHQNEAISTGLVSYAKGGNPLGVLAFNIFHLPWLFADFWNFRPGWLDTSLPAVVSILAAIVTAGLCYHGLKRGGIILRRYVVMAGLAVVICGIPLALWQANLSVYPNAVQMRYLAPLMIVLVSAILAARDNYPSRLPPLATAWFYLSIVMANSYALFVTIQRFAISLKNPPTSLRLSLGATWWRAGGPGPTATWALGSLGFALLALMVFYVGFRPKADAEPQLDEPESQQDEPADAAPEDQPATA